MEIAHVGMYFPSTTIVCKPRVQNWACCREVISDRPMLLPASQAHLETTHWGTRMHGSCSVEHDHVKNGTPQEVNKRKESLPHAERSRHRNCVGSNDLSGLHRCDDTKQRNLSLLHPKTGESGQQSSSQGFWSSTELQRASAHSVETGGHCAAVSATAKVPGEPLVEGLGFPGWGIISTMISSTKRPE